MGIWPPEKAWDQEGGITLMLIIVCTWGIVGMVTQRPPSSSSTSLRSSVWDLLFGNSGFIPVLVFCDVSF